MKMKRIPYKKLMKGIIKQVKFYIKEAGSVSYSSWIYANPFTGNVVFGEKPEDSHYYGLMAMFYTAGSLDDPREPDEHKIEHWVRVDLRKFAERTFQADCYLKEKFGTTS